MKEDRIVNSSTEEMIKKDNRKAGRKFAIVLVLSALVGAAIGFFIMPLSEGILGLSKNFAAFMTANIHAINIMVPALMIFITVILAIWCLYNISYSKKNAFVLIEADDTEKLSKIEDRLSYNLWGTTLVLIFQYFLFSLAVFIDFKYSTEGPKAMLYTIVPFIVGVLTLTVLQQKIVDCVRLMNPEKRGSVYDMNFNKKWEESCDEAEKFMIYKAAYKAYRVVSILCVFLWMIFVILGMVTGIGFLPTITVIIIWVVLVCVYNYYCIKYQR